MCHRVVGMVGVGGIIWFVAGHRPESVPANREHNNQVPSRCGLPKELPPLFAADGLGGNGHIRAAHDFPDLERRDAVSQNAAYVRGIPIEASEIVRPVLHHWSPSDDCGHGSGPLTSFRPDVIRT